MSCYSTDLDRLHKVAEGELLGRGVGKTTLAIQELAAILELKQVKDVFIVITTYKDMGYIKPMISQIFDEHNLSFKVLTQTEFESNSIRCKFVLDNDFEDKTRGCTNFSVIYMRHWD